MWALVRQPATLPLIACAVLIEAGFISLASGGRLASNVPSYVLHYLLLSTVYLAACWLTTRQNARVVGRGTLSLVWFAALVFRVTVLPLEPSLSEDTARYRWQGMMQVAGGDPYLNAPEEDRWIPLRDATWPRVTRKDLTSVYGPVYELFFAGWYRVTRSLSADPWQQVWLFKIPFALADLAVALALLYLLKGVGRPSGWVLIYLWSPLSIVEFWVEGHNDSLALVFVVLALGFFVRGRETTALACLAVATLGKFWPLILFPFFALYRREGKWRLAWPGLLVSAGTAVALCLPYRQSLSNVEHLLNGFVGGWRNNDSLFAYIYDYAGQDFDIATGLVKWAICFIVALIWGMRLDITKSALAAITATLLLSANCFPWYLTWILPLLTVYPAPALLLWAATVSLAYHPVMAYEAAGLWEYDRSLVNLEYLPVVIGLIAALAQAAVQKRHRLSAPRA